MAREYRTEIPGLVFKRNPRVCNISYVFLPYPLGSDAEGDKFSPHNGDYNNSIVYYEANGASYYYNDEGIPVKIHISENDFNKHLIQRSRLCN